MKEYKILRKSTYKILENEINKLAKEGWLFKSIHSTITYHGTANERHDFYAVIERDTE